MSMKLTVKGDWRKTQKFLAKARSNADPVNLDKYGALGVAALAEATPYDTGKTANSWFYTIDRSKESISLNFHNSNENDGVNVAVILQYGHGTRNGGYVRGINYINPALKPIFDEIAEKAWKEVFD